MQFKSIKHFIRGLFENESKERRVSDNFLTKIRNVDIDLTGKITRRRGYEYWSNLLENNSITSSLDIPDVSEKTGFQNKIQALHHYIDVANVKYNVVVSGGKVYIESLNTENSKVWTCLNPSGDIDLDDKTNHIDIKSYLDILFFNDYQNNVYMYNSQAYSEAGWTIAGNRYVYFAGQWIYFRNYSTFDTEYHSNEVTAADHSQATGSDTIDVDGDVRHQFEVGDTITVTGSTANDGDYTVNNIGLNGSDTQLTLDEDLTDSTVDGTVTSQYRIKIEDNAVNIEGDAIEQSLQDISYIGAGSEPISAATDLKLGYGIRVGNETTGFYYYVLDNGLNQRATDKCYLIKFNDRFIAQDFVELDMDTNGDVINFGYYDENIYIWCEDGKIHILDEDFVPSILDSGDVASLVAPTNSSSKKQYSLTVDSNGIFVYSVELPAKTDWWQPIIIENIDFSNSDPGEYSYGEITLGTNEKKTFNFLKELKSDTNLLSVDLDYDYRNIYAGSYIPVYALITYPPHLGGGTACVYVEHRWTQTHNYHGHKMTFGETFTFPDNKIGIWDFENIESFADTYGWCTGTYKKHLIDDLITGDSQTCDQALASQYNAGCSTQSSFHQYRYREVLATPITDKKLIYHTKFQYDKNLTTIANKQIWTLTANDLLAEQNAYYLNDTSYDSDTFTSVTESKHVLLIGLNFDGSLKSDSYTTVNSVTETWRYIIPLGIKGSELRNIVPLEINSNELYFGTSMVDGDTVVQDNGIYMKLNLDSFEFETMDCEQSAKKFQISGSNFWLLKGKPDETNYRASNDWDWSTGFDVYSDFISLDTYNSNLIYHIYKVVSGVTGSSVVDKLQYLGIPASPTVSMEYDSGSALEEGTQLRYYMVYLMNSGKTTKLSAPTEELEVPSLSADPQEVKMVLTGLNLENAFGLDIYDFADVDKIQVYRAQKDDGGTTWQDPLLIGQLSHDGTGWKSGSFAYETFEDNTQTYTYSPFTEGNVFEYPVNHIEVHKNRLVLINRIDYESPNIIQYSDTDVADAIPPGNVRSIEAGDGDFLVAGKSMGDYLYLFKTSKIYAILGDVYDGQLVDVEKSIGTKYKNLIAEYNNVVYFINNESIFALSGQKAVDINKHRIDNYFDTDRDNCIDFENIGENGFVYIDKINKEIQFFVPQKVNGLSQTENNLVIIFNIEYNLFKTYKYYHNIFHKVSVRDLITDDNEEIMADYNGNIYKITKSKNDDNKGIEYVIRTKPFTLGTQVLSKSYKLIKLFGKYLNHIRVTYWIDDDRKLGDVCYRATPSGKGEAIVDVWSEGRSNTIAIEISGKDLNDPPIEIDEILIGFMQLGGTR